MQSLTKLKPASKVHHIFVIMAVSWEKNDLPVQLVLESYNHAERLFQGVLNRKVKADASRNALAVLQRYRFLFNLPRSIERNIKNVSLLCK